MQKDNDVILIDNVNVAGCEYFCKYGNSCSFKQPFGFCKSDNCYYKELKKLEQENKELKESLKVFQKPDITNVLTLYRTGELDLQEERLNNYRSALEEIKEMAKFAQSLPCSDFSDCDNCDDEITNNGQFCMHKRIEEIKTKIDEVLNESK